MFQIILTFNFVFQSFQVRKIICTGSVFRKINFDCWISAANVC